MKMDVEFFISIVPSCQSRNKNTSRNPRCRIWDYKIDMRSFCRYSKGFLYFVRDFVQMGCWLLLTPEDVGSQAARLSHGGISSDRQVGSGNKLLVCLAQLKTFLSFRLMFADIHELKFSLQQNSIGLSQSKSNRMLSNPL